MPDVKTILLTGGTGFLGSHLTLALLQNGHNVTALARPSASRSAHERVLEVLTRVYGQTVPPEIVERLRVEEGDISRPQLGLDTAISDRLVGTVDEVWHSAASLSFLEEDRDEIFRMNVDGTQQVANFVSGTRSRRMIHVSTAYVAGDRTGRVFEEDLDAGQTFRNPYEESKFHAERMLRNATSDGTLAATVLRPSIVIGNSATGRATHFHGVYAFIRGLWTVARRLRRSRPASECVDLPLRIRGLETSTLNFVPVDFVTAAAVEISRQPSAIGKTFHLCNPEATPNHLWLGIICNQIGIRGVRLVDEESFDKEPMTRMEAIFHKQMTFYAPYLASEPAFDCSRATDFLKASGVRCPRVTPEFAARMTGWYIDLLNGTASG